MRADSPGRRVVAAAGVLALLTGCADPATDTPSAPVSTTSETVVETTVDNAGPHKTLQDYIAENGIAETQVRPGEPGVPIIKLPEPSPGWIDAGEQTPGAALGALVYTMPADPQDPPTITVILARLTGDVNPAEVLQSAPGELRNLPGYEPLGDAAPATLGGQQAVQLSGTYDRAGVRRVIAQKTVVIPASDGIYVLQINAEGRGDEQSVLEEATAAIDEFTTIEP